MDDGSIEKKKREENWAGAKGQGEALKGAAEKKGERRVERRGRGGGQRATAGRGWKRGIKRRRR